MEIKADNTDGWRGDTEEVSVGSNLPGDPPPGCGAGFFLWTKGVKQDKERMQVNHKQGLEAGT